MLMGIRDLHQRAILVPTPREQEALQAIWSLAQGWTAAAMVHALGRNPTPSDGGYQPSVRAGLEP